ncbi:MAG: M23 family metallopeptidase [Chthoniobacterales bacterium]
MPFHGFWFVAGGGVTRKESHSWSVISQRYAYDFHIPLALHSAGSGLSLDSFPCFGEPILCPADGIVVEMRDSISDFSYPRTGWFDWSAKDIRGNYIVIRHNRFCYGVLAHLKYGTVRVRVGESVRRGKVVALCGNSGRSTEPHLHFHVQDTPSFCTAAGIPINFAAYAESHSGRTRINKNEPLCSGRWVATYLDGQGEE